MFVHGIVASREEVDEMRGTEAVGAQEIRDERVVLQRDKLRAQREAAPVGTRALRGIPTRLLRSRGFEFAKQ